VTADRDSTHRAAPDATDGSRSSVMPAEHGRDPKVDARPAAQKGHRAGHRSKRQLPLWQEVFVLLAIALGLAILLKSLFVQAFYIPSASMNDTLIKNDRILVEKPSYWFDGPERGDVVVFADPGGWLNAIPQSNAVQRGLEFFGLYPAGNHLVKRVIGVGGDRVECCDDRGRVSVNGVPLAEGAYLQRGVAPSETPFDVEVPEDALWVMGDNRLESGDSRVHIEDVGEGFVPAEDVVGKVWAIVWPVDRLELLDRPAVFDAAALEES